MRPYADQTNRGGRGPSYREIQLSSPSHVSVHAARGAAPLVNRGAWLDSRAAPPGHGFRCGETRPNHRHHCCCRSTRNPVTGADAWFRRGLDSSAVAFRAARMFTASHCWCLDARGKSQRGRSQALEVITARFPEKPSGGAHDNHVCREMERCQHY